MSEKKRGLSPVIRKSILAATAITILIMAQNIQTAKSGEDRTYDNERLLLAEKIKKILISHGVCG